MNKFGMCLLNIHYILTRASHVVLVVKNQFASAGDTRDVGLIPGLGRSPGKGNSNPLQYSCLENPMDRGAWWATDHGVTKNQTQLSVHTQHRLITTVEELTNRNARL